MKKGAKWTVSCPYRHRVQPVSIHCTDDNEESLEACVGLYHCPLGETRVALDFNNGEPASPLVYDEIITMAMKALPLTAVRRIFRRSRRLHSCLVPWIPVDFSLTGEISRTSPWADTPLTGSWKLICAWHSIMIPWWRRSRSQACGACLQTGTAAGQRCGGIVF